MNQPQISTTTRTLCQQFMDNVDFDFIVFEVSHPYEDESDSSLCNIDVIANLCGIEEVDHYGELSIEKAAFDGLSDTDMMFKIIEIVFEALGFGEPPLGFQIGTNTTSGELFTMRWSIGKVDRELTASQVEDIADFLNGYGAPNLAILNYGNHHINDDQYITTELVKRPFLLH